LALTCVLPIGFIVGFLVYYSYQQHQRAIEGSLLETTRALSMVVDQEFATMQASMTALATSPSLATGDLATFHHQMELVLRDYPGADIVLADATGQQLVNSFVPFGKPLPKRNVPEAVRGIYATGKPTISNLFKGTISGRPILSVDVPVFLGERVDYDLALTVPAERLQAVFSQQRIPTEWPSAIIDGNSIVVARNRLAEKYVGTQISLIFIKRLAEASEGSGEFPTKEGTTVVGMFSRSTKTGWTFFVGIPKAVFIASVWRSLKWVVFGIILLSITTVTLALFLIQRIAASVAERKRAEDALSESDERLRLFIEYAPVALAMFDRYMRYLYVSRHWMTNYNLGDRDLRGLTHYEIFPEIGDEWKQSHSRGMAGEVLRSEGDRFVRGDGSVQWVRWEIRPWHNAQGEVGGIVIFTEDITERKRSEEALRSSQAKLQSIIGSAMDAVISVDEQQRIVVFNRAAEAVFQCAASEAFGSTLDRFIPKSLRESHRVGRAKQRITASIGTIRVKVVGQFVNHAV
jgi:PAS domain S-box-containing protein